MTIPEEIYLAHYGVKGMRWGIRHDPERSARRRAAREARDKKIAAINRKYDKQYGKAKYTRANPHAADARLIDQAKVSTGKRFASSFLTAFIGTSVYSGTLGAYTSKERAAKTLAVNAIEAASAAAFMTKLQDVKIERTLDKYDNTGKLRRN